MELGIYVVCFISCVSARMNVLFLCADDLRPELPMYNGFYRPSQVHPPIHVPNLEGLASKSMVFKRAYTQQALCSPSRTSLLTGRRPDTTHVYDLRTYFRDSAGNFTTIPQFFKNHGYHSIGAGKIFHPGVGSGGNDPVSWSETYYDDYQPYDYRTSWEAVPDNLLDSHNALQDTMLADHAVQVIKDIAQKAKNGENFFLAVGFHRPHLPFQFPARFLDYYPEDSIDLPPNPQAPDGMPEIAWYSYNELRSYADIARLNASGNPNTTLPDQVVKQLRRAYYSAVSFMDFELGRVLDELENQGLADNTIVSFFGDHGWQLGEHGEWGKQTNFDIATHSPLMIRVPGMTDHGMSTTKLTEFVDLFPTLVEAAGLPTLPTCQVDSSSTHACTEGRSLVPLLQHPNLPSWKTAAFSQYPRVYNNTSAMGYAITTWRYRYTEWVTFLSMPHYMPQWDQLHGVELYDHLADPEENHNLALNAAQQGLRSRLSGQLHAGWRAEMTDGHGRPIVG
ncbi:iduronate 2-sulfatase-like [Haliotis rufescens]|uniref:iduronate 2-sulfatase-like n=1 Tax=Haliotis rufescens TaxID=6454 RepID=UPI00201F709C|nr:iduronate 2-sulfatase-like [Haliotis rufescens]